LVILTVRVSDNLSSIYEFWPNDLEVIPTLPILQAPNCSIDEG
jgi:hypothetical protein